MVQQVKNVQNSIKELLKTNWTLADAMDKEKIQWASNILKNTERQQFVYSIEVTRTTGVNTPQSQKITKMYPLFKIDLWINLRDPTGDDDRQVLENNRMVIIDEIYRIIHDNQISVTGLNIATFGKEMTADDLETQGFNVLHTTLFIEGEYYHTKT